MALRILESGVQTQRCTRCMCSAYMEEDVTTNYSEMNYPDKSELDLPGAVVVGIDGSDSSRRALEWAAEYAHQMARPLVAVSAWEWPGRFGAFAPWPSSTDFERDARHILVESIEKALGPDRAPRVGWKVVRGQPAIVLVEASRTAALVVVGSRGHGEIVGMFLGSVSEYLSTHAHCPVVIVRGD